MSGPKIIWVIPILGGIRITETTLTSWIAMAVIILIAFILTRKLSVHNPGKRQIIAEKLVTVLYDFVADAMGAHNVKFAPYIGTLFLSSIVGTLLGMTSILRAATADISTTLAWAIATTALVWFYSIKNSGFLGWLKGFVDPIPVMLPMNIISEIANPVSLSFRHFGNIAGGAVLTSLIYSSLAGLSAALLKCIPSEFIKTIPIFQLGIPAVLSIYFDLFAGAVQALIFCTLSMIFIAGANPPKSNASH